jgi:hypothetical protein
MGAKTIWGAGFLGVGAVLFLALAARHEPAPKPARTAKAEPAAAPVREAAAAPVESPAVPIAAASPETALIRGRVERMESRLRELETRRDELASANKELEDQLAQKAAESSSRAMADWRVQAWSGSLGLSEAQKQSLREIAVRWAREDAVRKPDRGTWRAREEEFRPQLTVEQQARQHDIAVNQTSIQWSNMGQTLGGMLGLSPDDRDRFQRSLGEIAIPNSMLLPEAHGLDWSGEAREAAARAKPGLTPDQSAKLDKYVGRF